MLAMAENLASLNFSTHFCFFRMRLIVESNTDDDRGGCDGAEKL